MKYEEEKGKGKKKKGIESPFSERNADVGSVAKPDARRVEGIFKVKNASAAVNPKRNGG